MNYEENRDLWMMGRQDRQIYHLCLENDELRNRIKELEELVYKKDIQIAELRADIEALC